MIERVLNAVELLKGEKRYWAREHNYKGSRSRGFWLNLRLVRVAQAAVGEALLQPRYFSPEEREHFEMLRHEALKALAHMERFLFALPSEAGELPEPLKKYL